MAAIYARLINQYKFNYHILFSASFYEINEEDQRCCKTELFKNLKMNHNLLETDFKNFEVKSQL